MTSKKQTQLETKESPKLVEQYDNLLRQLRFERTTSEVLKGVQTTNVNSSTAKELVEQFTNVPVTDTATYENYKGHDIVILSTGENNTDRRITRLNCIVARDSVRGFITSQVVDKPRFTREITYAIKIVVGFHRYIQKIHHEVNRTNNVCCDNEMINPEANR